MSRIFLARADVLQQLGKTVLVSRFAEFHQLGQFFARYTREPVGVILGTGLLEVIFLDKWYEDLDGGILESFGRLFKHRSRIYIYPTVDSGSGKNETRKRCRNPVAFASSFRLSAGEQLHSGNSGMFGRIVLCRRVPTFDA